MTLKVGCLNNEVKKFDKQSTLTSWVETYRGNALSYLRFCISS